MKSNPNVGPGESGVYAGSPRNIKDRYQILNEEEWVEATTALLEWYQVYLTDADYPDDLEFVIRQRDIADIIARIDKRAAYYLYFHDMEISERKRAALYAYWIAKLRPFTIVDERFRHTNEAACVNERFAAFILVSSMYIEDQKEHVDPKILSSDYYKKLLYSLRYRNIGIDAIILLAESLTVETFNQVFSANNDSSPEDIQL